MTRFYVAAIITVILCAAALAVHHYILAGAVVFALLILSGFGVAIPQMRWFGNFVCSGRNSKKQVALTFDDGPDPKSTPLLLELLHREKVPAAFFCIGIRVQENPLLAAQIIREGHLLENHSFAHSNLTNFYPVSRLVAELRQAQTAVKNACGITPRFFRPPIGLSNPNIFRAARILDLTVIGWTIRSFDTISTEPQKIIGRVLRGLRPGAIILLHDGKIPAERLVATVKSLLDESRKLGYEMVRLDELLK